MVEDKDRSGFIRTERSFVDRVIGFCLDLKIVVFLMVVLLVGWGILVAPFDWEIGGALRRPVPVDAIPDIGENQQIVFTEWMGRSPQDVEDQITYPLTTSLLGIPGVRTIRSYSMFGFSTIYVIFGEDVEFYWSRSRVLEKLNSLPAGILPPGVQPALGPDATALGQVFWYTLEGRDPEGRPTGGWDLHELRTIQDWHVRYGLLSAEGVSEVASVGGFVREYQIDVDPYALRAFRVGIDEVYDAVRMSNLDVGAGTIEINRVEYVIRGLGFIKEVEDVSESVIVSRDNVPVRIRDVANVTLGPAVRRGVLDKEGAEVVGGVVAVRYGENPLAVIRNVKERIEEIAPGLARKTLPDGTVSQVAVVPFYDRTGLIHETLWTLYSALSAQVLVTIIVVLVIVAHLRSSFLISGVLPLAVLMTFIAMKLFNVDANIVALSGIAIAIGTMVDMGIIICENILKHLDEAEPGASRSDVVLRASGEVSGAVLTAVSTTVVSFLPVFTMTGPEGKLFRPLAFTKTFALIASVMVALTVIPPLAHLIFRRRGERREGSRIRPLLYLAIMGFGLFLAATTAWWLGAAAFALGLYSLAEGRIPERLKGWISRGTIWVIALIVALALTEFWLPLGPERGGLRNFIFVAVIIGGILAAFQAYLWVYGPLLRWCLAHKALFLSIPLFITFLGALIWLGFDALFGWLPDPVREMRPVSAVARTFPGPGREFMPPLDEGSYFYMPTIMPHGSIAEAYDILQRQDMAIRTIPEVETVVGKLGRAESPLDPAPISMFETVINYRQEYITDREGRRLRFRFDPGGTDLFRDERGVVVPALDGRPYVVRGRFARDEEGRLIPDPRGIPFRVWRPPLDPQLNPGRDADPGTRRPDDIWDRIVKAAEVPGATSAPKLQPIAARIVMLQSGMRAPMGVKIRGPDLQTIEQVGFQIEQYLKEVPSVEPATVVADRIVGKPYIEIEIDRQAIARYGMRLQKVQDVIEVAVGGRQITTTVEGRERYPVRVRYLRELRDDIESLKRILVPGPGEDIHIPLVQLADIRYVRGPQMIRAEDTFLVGYVIFDRKAGYAEVDVVEQAQAYLGRKIASGEWELPAGVSFAFAGTYENQVRAQQTLSIVLPVALFVIFMILYLQFRAALTTFMVFSGILVAWSGGFLMTWLYGQSWFLNFSVFSVSMRDLFQVHPINLSVAIWVGFLALFGIATDDGVLMATYLDESFRSRRPQTVPEVREAVVAGAVRRIRPALMTSATTILALIPVLTSTGRGADIMVPMAIPSFGGMLVASITVLVVPVLYCAREERRLSA